MMIDEIQPAAREAHPDQSFDAKANLRHPAKDRAVQARAGRRERRFTLDVIREDEAGNDETISIDKLTATAGADMSPIIRLVDTTIFTALQRRASDIHIETRDDSSTSSFVSTEC